jgi:NAD-dependent protein deacetylases, SIR2 family
MPSTESQELREAARRCSDFIQDSRRVVLLSGAGMSTAAGIADFRGPQGFYRTVQIENPERIFDIETFREDPSLFYRFHRELVRLLERVKPTFAHRFFAALEQAGSMQGIITQNIDSLHQKAGSKNVLEIHGGVWQSYCFDCGKEYSYDVARDKTLAETVPTCDSCGGPIKPNVVFFGEAVKYLFECQQLARNADLFFILGSSLTVTPAALLPALAPGRIVVVNQGPLSHAYLPEDRIDLLVPADINTFFEEVNTILHLPVGNS